MNLSEKMRFNSEISDEYIKEGNQFTWDEEDEFEYVYDIIGAAAELGHNSIMIENKNVGSKAIEMLRQEGFYLKNEGLFIYIGWQ